MDSLRLLCVVFSVIVTRINASDCPFDTTIDWVKPCDGKQSELYNVMEPKIRLAGKDCYAILNGCFDPSQLIKNGTASYTVWKDGVQLTKGSQVMCGYNYKDLKVDCPMKKGNKICVKDFKETNPVKRLLDVWCGVWKMEFKVTTPNGESECIVGQGRLHKTK